MSLNSVDSKMSPHSRHSTNSASSSRATICTRGCLHSLAETLSGDCGGGLGVINPGDHKKPGEAAVRFTGNWRYFSVTLGLVKSFRKSRRGTGFHSPVRSTMCFLRERQPDHDKYDRKDRHPINH